MTPAEFDEAVAIFRSVAGGDVSVNDFFVVDERPYRYARLSVECSSETVVERFAELHAIAVRFGSHMTVWTHRSVIELAAKRDLDQSELYGADGLFVCRPVVEPK